MKVFKRGIFSFIKSIIIAIVTGVFLWFILGLFEWFQVNQIALYAIPGGITLILLYRSFFSENIKIEIEEDGTLRYFKNRKLRETINLKESMVGYSVKTRDGSAEVADLYIYEAGAKDITIDCEPLGITKFYRMYEEIKVYAKEQSDKLETKQKNKEEVEENPIKEK